VDRPAATRSANSSQPNSFHTRKYSKPKTRHHRSGWIRWSWWCSSWYSGAWDTRCCASCDAQKRRDIYLSIYLCISIWADIEPV